MTRKAARGRKTAARARTTTARTTTRTGRKTSSARASKTATRTSRNGRGTPAKRAAAPSASRPNQIVETEVMHEPLPAAQHEDDEDTDWLGEDEDPRSQIVEGDDEWEPQSDDEW
jgi:hypothetical protein